MIMLCPADLFRDRPLVLHWFRVQGLKLTPLAHAQARLQKARVGIASTLAEKKNTPFWARRPYIPGLRQIAELITQE